MQKETAGVQGAAAKEPETKKPPKKVATRESYGNALRELAEEFPDLVVLDADLAAATKTSIFKKAYPERHIDCGIAEANMMGVAAGLSLVGKIPFVSSFEIGRAHV